MSMKKIINPWRNHPEYNCFGCCPDNPIGLHLEFYEDGDYIVSKWNPQHNYQGWVTITCWQLARGVALVMALKPTPHGTS